MHAFFLRLIDRVLLIRSARNERLPVKTVAYAARSIGEPLRPIQIECRGLQADDVALEVLYCRVCRNDLAVLRDPRGTYPAVPGRRLVGRVLDAGRAVRRFRVGEVVAVIDAHPYGGYAKHLVIREDSAFAVPEGVDLPRIAAHLPGHGDCIRQALCATAAYELVRLEDINQVFACLESGDLRAHLVIDMQASLNDELERYW